MNEKLEITGTIKTTKGDINIKFFPEVAPIAVINLITLNECGYYTNRKFDRVEKNFVIQAGDPDNIGVEELGYVFDNEVDTNYKYDKGGKLGVGNIGPGTNCSQFFITHVEVQRLNMGYTIFGEVATKKDLDVVNLIEVGDIIKSIVISGDTDKLRKNHKEFLEKVKSCMVKNYKKIKI